jgi:hypothetical protein
MFKNWCKSEMCWIDLKCLSMFCGWDLNYANCLRTCHIETVYVLWNYVLSLRTCHVETVYVLWRNWVLNDFKVFDEMLDLFSFKRMWFSNCIIL